MGFFSWKTSDSNKIITHNYSKNGALPVYLVCPDNTLLYEPDYDGYGHFAGKDAYVLLARWNFPEMCNGDDIDDRNIGIIAEDKILNHNAYVKAKDELVNTILSFLEDMANDSECDFYIHAFMGEISKLRGKLMSLNFPLKFVEDPNNCIYANLPPAECDWTQGFGTEEEDGEE